MANRQVTVRVDDEKYAILDKMASKKGTSVNAICNTLIDKQLAVEYSESNRTEIELMLRRAAEDAQAPTANRLGKMLARALKSIFFIEIFLVDFVSKFANQFEGFQYNLDDSHANAKDKAAKLLIGKTKDEK